MKKGSGDNAGGFIVLGSEKKGRLNSDVRVMASVQARFWIKE